MILFRATFTRDSRIRGFTFAHDNLALASEFAYTVLQGYAMSNGGSFIHSVERTDSHEAKLQNRERNKRRSAVQGV